MLLVALEAVAVNDTMLSNVALLIRFFQNTTGYDEDVSTNKGYDIYVKGARALGEGCSAAAAAAATAAAFKS
jgi:hypothetical protein